MSVSVYNSLTKQKEEVLPLDGKTLRIYSCGVTVYDKCHIGHARSLYIFEMITSYLKYRGYDVCFVRNITDIDDKIIARAHLLGKTSEEVARENIEKYKNDLRLLGIAEADHEPRATENIPEMIAHISALIAKGFAYESDGDVYFKVRAFTEYGKLSGQSVEKMLEAVRIEQDTKKKDPLDFALWKRSKEGEPRYKSPWGDGRPGWHIECSVMSMKYLQTQTIDIHAGGRDLIFPHHENEVAQAEALTGKPFARYWIHNGLLTINGQKMAKSLGNFITVEDAVGKYPVDDLKMFFLGAQYASPIDFSDAKLQEAHRVVDRVKRTIERAAAFPTSVENDIPAQSVIDAFLSAMDDDFNTPQALGHLFDLIAQANKQMDAGHAPAGIAFLKDIFARVFHLSLQAPVAALTPQQNALLLERKDARANKDFKRSDELRDALRALGIEVQDGKDGQTWRRA